MINQMTINGKQSTLPMHGAKALGRHIDVTLA
jgi:hypothetical protein